MKLASTLAYCIAWFALFGLTLALLDGPQRNTIALLNAWWAALYVCSRSASKPPLVLLSIVALGIAGTSLGLGLEGPLLFGHAGWESMGGLDWELRALAAGLWTLLFMSPSMVDRVLGRAMGLLAPRHAKGSLRSPRGAP